ncbi:MAG: HlyD family efflux transporter periplasmic adaptor subunit, partial [Acidobacteria bacterium]|nr:HlyD family efflux transporter periplasmic adaptor subunit [Acidobacteriota bacterium]
MTVRDVAARGTALLQEIKRPGQRRDLAVQVAVWTVAALTCVVLLVAREGSPHMVGVARGRIAQLSVPWATRVETVPVELFQEVRAGEVVALLDDDVQEAQIATVRAEIARLKAEHAQTEAEADAEAGERLARWSADERAFARDSAEFAVRIQEVRVDIEEDRALLDGLRAKAELYEKLAARGHASTSDLELARSEAAAVAGRLHENERLEADLAGRLREAEARFGRYGKRPPPAVPRARAADHLQQAIKVQEGLLRELEVQRAQCILRAPFDGVVVPLHGSAGVATLLVPGEGDLRRTGEVVGPGDPVIAIAAEEPTEVVAYALSGGRSPKLRPGMEVELRTTGSARQIGRSRIAAVSPTVERLPDRLWRNAQFPEFGRPCTLPVP